MTKFCKVLSLFLIVPLLIVLIDIFSPFNAFTFRQWEALRFNNISLTYGYFYPLQTITMYEVGDLGRHTPYEVKKLTTWKTDELGYRNDQYVYSPDVLLIGDSFFAGASLTQDSTVGDLLQNKLDSVYNNHLHKVYNISINGFEKFEYLLKAKKLSKPKVIVFSIVERSVNSLPEFQSDESISVKQKIKNYIINKLPYQVPVFIDRLAKQSFLRYLNVKINHLEPAGLFIKQNGVRAEKKMLFRDSSNLKIFRAEVVTSGSINALLSYQKYCKANGIKFIFVPIPDKETIYYDKVSLNNTQSDYLLRLDSALKKNDISSVNVFNLFNEKKMTDPATVLYQYDDTHWNSNAVNIVTDALIQKLVKIND